MSGDHPAAATLAARVRHVEALLEQRGLVDGTELDRALEAFLAGLAGQRRAGSSPAPGPTPAFRERLLADANAALPELGLSMGGGIQEQRLKVVENTATTHNVIVCTLCSCYPIALLGPSPTWYKSEAYRSRVVRDPRGVLAEFGLRRCPRTPRSRCGTPARRRRYMVLPRRPEGEPTADRVTRNGLIGVAVL